MKVLRLGTGDLLVAVLPGGPEVLCRLEVTGGDPRLLPLEERQPRSEPPVDVTLFQGLPKGDKMDLVVEKSSEIGVSRVVPVVTHRSVSRADPRSSPRKVERWRRIARGAAALSGRLIIPEVTEVMDWSGAMSLVESLPLVVMPWEAGAPGGLREALRDAPSSIGVFIGPEGGFEKHEVEEGMKRGLLPVSLGPRILRTETAAIAALALVMGIVGDLGGPRDSWNTGWQSPETGESNNS
jgi:16S rRNA (uracil1498-N3)-methyltransferase